jgi:folate-binding protein YgfZ
MSAPTRLDRGLIRVSGPDAVSFLDNLLTQDVERLDEASVLYGALLSPQGKVICDMFLWRGDSDGVVIEADTTRASDLLRRLAIYKLRAQVVVEDVGAILGVATADAPFEGAVADPRLAGLGWRRLVSRDEAATMTDGTEAYDHKRLALGVPDLAHDAAPEEVFALEALLEELNGVDFRKGCFVGQENVSRMKRRATTRKKFCPIAFDGPAPAFGAPVLAGGAEVGTVRTGEAGRALALLRLDRAIEALDAGQTLTVEARSARLDPPSWLILPVRAAGGAGEAD